MYIILLIP